LLFDEEKVKKEVSFGGFEFCFRKRFMEKEIFDGKKSKCIDRRTKSFIISIDISNSKFFKLIFVYLEKFN
jgi:hypothetical protein